MIDIQRAALAVARGYKCRYAGDCAQARSYLIVQIQFKKVDVIDDGVVIDGALFLIDGSNVVLVGVVNAKTRRHCQAVQHVGARGVPDVGLRSRRESRDDRLWCVCRDATLRICNGMHCNQRCEQSDRDSRTW